MQSDIQRVLIDKAGIAERVTCMANELNDDYKQKKPLFLCVLKGAVIFFSDLIRQIEACIDIDFIIVSSYNNGTTKSSEIVLERGIDNVSGRDVVIVEDILDTGKTMKYVKSYILENGANSVKLCCFLDKPSRREVNIVADYIGFEVENEFVVGYGLDYNQKYRNLQEVCVLKSEVYK